jgi:phosphocarrier protein
MSGAPPTAEQNASLEIRNRLGLHARAAVLLVQTANRFEAEVAISKDGQSVNGRSIMGIMMLAAEQGSTIDVTTSGPQAAEALEAIRELVEAGFHESG